MRYPEGKEQQLVGQDNKVAAALCGTLYSVLCRVPPLP